MVSQLRNSDPFTVCRPSQLTLTFNLDNLLLYVSEEKNVETVLFILKRHDLQIHKDLCTSGWHPLSQRRIQWAQWCWVHVQSGHLGFALLSGLPIGNGRNVTLIIFRYNSLKTDCKVRFTCLLLTVNYRVFYHEEIAWFCHCHWGDVISRLSDLQNETRSFKFSYFNWTSCMSQSSKCNV